MTWTSSSEGLSIVIPTYNERENIEQLLTEIRALQPHLTGPLEVVLVDDGSPDGTADLAQEFSRRLKVDARVLTRNGRRSLGGAIAAGLDSCRWDLVCVMDADLSHPAALVPVLIDSLDGVDGVVASRYTAGGEIGSWPLNRRLVSLLATALSRIFLRVAYRDPLSGFFLLRRSSLKGIQITGDGNKPLLEILVRARPAMKEVPYRFDDRRNGQSKLNGTGILEFMRLVLRLRSAEAKVLGPASRSSADNHQPRSLG